MLVVKERLAAVEKAGPKTHVEEALVSLARVLVDKIETLQKRVERLEATRSSP